LNSKKILIFNQIGRILFDALFEGAPDSEHLQMRIIPSIHHRATPSSQYGPPAKTPSATHQRGKVLTAFEAAGAAPVSRKHDEYKAYVLFVRRLPAEPGQFAG
jgi:hypothetical protein